MPITIDQYNTSIPLGRGGKYGTLAIEPERFPANVQTYIYMYGLRQVINDAMADKTDDDGNTLPVDQIVAKAEKRLANMYAGELRAQRGESAEPVDPVEAEAWKMAKDALMVAYKNLIAGGHMTAPAKGTKDRFAYCANQRRLTRGLPELPPVEATASAIEIYLAHPSNAHVRKAAERIVRERTKAAGTVDLDELGV